MGDLERAVAILFKRKGKGSLTEKEFVFSASMDLRWFPPKEAQKLLELGLKKGLLSLEEGKLRPTFDLESMDAPLDFVPPAEVLNEEENLFQRLVEAIAVASGQARKRVVASINAVQSKMGIYAEAAALIAGQRAGVDMASFYGEVEALIEKRRPSADA